MKLEYYTPTEGLYRASLELSDAQTPDEFYACIDKLKAEWRKWSQSFESYQFVEKWMTLSEVIRSLQTICFVGDHSRFERDIEILEGLIPTDSDVAKNQAIERAIDARQEAV